MEYRYQIHANELLMLMVEMHAHVFWVTHLRFDVEIFQIIKKKKGSIIESLNFSTNAGSFYLDSCVKHFVSLSENIVLALK
jgi:hypothetical protein